MKEVIEQAITGLKEASEELIQLFNERFLHLAQNIVCNDEAARIIAKNASEAIRQRLDEMKSQDSLIQWTQDILDAEIEKYFQGLLHEIKDGSGAVRNKLMKMLNERFSKIIKNKIMYDEGMTLEDAKDIVQNALKTVSERYRDANPRGTFIQWAQMVLKNKYLEYRRSHFKHRKRSQSLLNEKYEPVYKKRMSDVLQRKRTVKEVTTEEVETLGIQVSDAAKQNALECDPYEWDPAVLVDYMDLKCNLLSIIKDMGKRCRRVFKVLFSEGHVKFVHQAFPNMTRNQIDVIISRCRKKLRLELKKLGIIF